MRRFDPDTVQNGHIYSSIKEEEIVGAGNNCFVLVVCKYREIFYF